MKKLGKLMLMLTAVTVFLCTLALQASAEVRNGVCGADVSWSFDISSGVMLISGEGDMDNHISGSNVPWYSFRDSIKAVRIQSGITSVGDMSFYFCKNITTVSLPTGLKRISKDAFGFCKSLQKISIPNSVTSIGSSAFSSCDSLTSVTIPYGVTSIEKDTFSTCGGITSVTIPESVTSIGDSAFYNCYSLTTVTIPKSVTSIGKSAFESCGKLTSINVDSKNLNYRSSDGVLFDRSKTILCAYPAGKTDTSYNIPDTVTSIVPKAFKWCRNLTSVTIPEGVTSIENEVFSQCSYLTSVTIPDSVTSIGKEAFGFCLRLTGITLPTGVTSIGEGAFDETGLISITIPGSVTSMGKDVFSGSSLRSITLSSGITSIGKQMFNNCYNLTDITIPASVTTIEDGAFYDCEELKYVFYSGTSTQWNSIQIGSDNEYLSFCDLIHFNSTGHNWNEGTVVEAATCTADGSKTLECTYTDCDATITQVIPKKGHTLTTLKAKAATCTETGLTEGKKCSACGEVTVAQETVAKLPHTEVAIEGKEATCTQAGLTEGKKCSVCGTVTKEQATIKALGHKEGYGSDFAAPECEYDGVTEEIICERCEIVLKPAKTIPATGHSYKTTTTKATTSKDGKTVKTCENCSKKVTTTIYKVTSFKLSTTSYTYNGSAKTPSVTVKDSKGKSLKKDTDYTVKYASGRKSVGKYMVTVTLKGKYSGTKSLSFTIVPKATSKITVTQTTTSIKATWSKVSGATGYKVYIYKGSKLVASKTVSSKTTSYSFTKLTAGTNYTVKVKTYQTVSKVNYWSSTKSLATATKTKTPSITSVKAGSKSATVKWSNVSGENGYQVYYATSKNGTYKKGATTKANDVDATIKSLTKGKTYYFKVRAYKTADSGTVYSAWSAVKSVKVK